MLGAIGRQWLVAAAALAASLTVSAADLVGSPPYVRFAPDIDVHPQNFAIARDASGIVYVGNLNGVLEFDGEHWSLIALPNRDLVRSLNVGEDDRVYVGGYGSFGYLQRDRGGKSSFVDLTPRFHESLRGHELADIWHIAVTPEGIYFRALRDVFWWDPKSDRVKHWRHEGRFGAMVHHQGETLLQFRGEGIKRRDGDDWSLLSGTRSLVDLIYDLTPLIDGGLLITGVTGAWWHLKDGTLAPAQMPPKMPSSADFQNAEALEDGSIALGSSDGMIYIVDPELKTERHFRIDPGWLSGLWASQDGGFLVSGNLAIYRVAWPTPWSVLGDEHGATGSLQNLAHWNDVDYLLSSGRVQKMSPNAGGLPTLEQVTWHAEGGYDLIGIDAERALLASKHKLLLVKNDASSAIGEELVYPRMFKRSRFRNDRIYVGTETGLRLAQVTPTTVTLSALANAGLDMRVSSIAEVSAQELWFGTERHGLWHVQIDEAGQISTQKRYGENEGLKLGVIPETAVVQLIDGNIVVSTHRGFFRHTADRFVADDLFGLAALRNDEELLRIVQADNGELWGYGFGRAFRRRNGGAWIEQPIRHLRRGAIEAYAPRTNTGIGFVTTQALLLYAGDKLISSAPSPGVSLRSVARVLPDGSEQALPLLAMSPVSLQHGDFGINFRFSLPDLSQAHAPMYQGRLLGYEEEFSAWSRVHAYTYARLSPGSYSLQVRARDSAGGISEIAPYHLMVMPPWYLTWWACLTWTLLGMALLWQATVYAVRRRTQRLAEDKRVLETTVAERTRDLANANLRLEQMANLDGLTGIANRRRLDEYLQIAWTQCRDRQRPLAVIVIDVDHFKRFNDSRGHLAGDQLLKNLVPLLSRCLRRSEDLLARYGGEEFLAVLPGADAATAAGIAEAMWREIATSDLGATISIGAASWVPNGSDVSTLVKAADLALYAAKNNGRNRVVFSDTTREPGKL